MELDDVKTIYQQELEAAQGDTFQALRGTRTRVHAALDQEAGEPPHFQETCGAMKVPGVHPGKAPSSTESQHLVQKAHQLDLWTKADDLVRQAGVAAAEHEHHLGAAPPQAIAPDDLAGHARKTSGGN